MTSFGSLIYRWVTKIGSFVSDGIDGKQARRTQTSGPLGELFDHGLDSWTAMLITVCMYSVFGRTDHSVSPLRMYFILWNVFVNFYLSHWEKYNTGVLFLPWGYDASMLVNMDPSLNNNCQLLLFNGNRISVDSATQFYDSFF